MAEKKGVRPRPAGRDWSFQCRVDGVYPAERNKTSLATGSRARSFERLERLWSDDFTAKEGKDDVFIL